MGTRSVGTYSGVAGLHTGFPHPFLPPVERASPQCVVQSLPFLPRTSKITTVKGAQPRRSVGTRRYRRGSANSIVYRGELRVPIDLSLGSDRRLDEVAGDLGLAFA